MASVDLSAARWRKSSYSGYGNDDNCVEIAALPTTVAVRDSKRSQHGVLTVGVAAWTAFRTNVRAFSPDSALGTWL